MQVTWLLVELLLCVVVAAAQISSSESVDDTCVDLKCDIAMSRRIVKKILSVEQAEGVGARVRRSVGRPEVDFLDTDDEIV